MTITEKPINQHATEVTLSVYELQSLLNKYANLKDAEREFMLAPTPEDCKPSEEVKEFTKARKNFACYASQIVGDVDLNYQW